MTRAVHPTGILVLAVLAPFATAQEWPTFVNQTALHLPTGPGLNDPALSTADDQAKNYAWGDVDLDGDVDLICVRKAPYNDAGRRRNVLFLNEGTAEGHAVDGVLVDRTAEFASDADDGGSGFLDLTADRDVVLLDVDGDGWLDMVTTTTYGQGLPKTISHPRVYINRQSADGAWLGFRYEEARTPTLPMTPNFCGIGFGDVTGDGLPDLYHTDYTNDLEDRLWINDGSGTFLDQSAARMTFEMRESEFGVHAVIADMNGDGANDVVKDRANGAPYRITISYNDPDNEGFFDDFETVYTGAPYYVLVTDLNMDDLPDIVLQDDGIDRYLLNQGNGPDGLADFVGFAFPSQSNGFEGVIELGDLNNDGFVDVLVSDETVNGVGTPCSRRLLIWRNSGNLPAVNFDEQTGGIPLSARTGTWDVAPMDLNGDGWLDLVIGTCDGTSVWISQPPLGVNFAYPAGLPETVPSDGIDVPVTLQAFGAELDPLNPPALEVRFDGGPFIGVPLTSLGGDQYNAAFPSGGCLEIAEYYFSAQLEGGGTFSDPAGAPQATYTTIVADDIGLLLEDTLEADVGGWTVENDPTLTSGSWQHADPNGTLQSGGFAAPEDDATPDGVLAFVTENGPPGASAGSHDVDGGGTRLMSPIFAVPGLDARVSYSIWHYSQFSTPDVLTVEVSADGGNQWVAIEDISGTGGEWIESSFIVGRHITPGEQMRVRFSTSDFDLSLTESGVDDFRVESLDCLFNCPGDLNGDAAVDAADLALLLGGWGNAPGHPADLNQDGSVNAADLALLLGNWGGC